MGCRSSRPLLAVGVALRPRVVPEGRSRRAPASGEPRIDQKVVSKQSETLGKKIAEQRKEMDKEKFAEAEKLLAEVEKAANELAKAPPAEKDKAMMALNKLTDALKDRQKQLGSPEQVNRQLQQLKEMASNGPADEFMKDLAKGDFEKAAKELKKLQEKLASGKMTEQEKKALQGADRRDEQAAQEARQPGPAQEAAREGPQERRALQGAVREGDGQARRPDEGPGEPPEDGRAARQGPASR